MTAVDERETRVRADGSGPEALAWREALRLRRAVLTVGLAVGGLVASLHYGGVLGGPGSLTDRLIAFGGATLFLICACMAVHGATTDLLKLVPHAFGDARRAALRMVSLLCGYVLVVLGALSLLHVSWSRLLLGGALTGVVLGIAAQPVLGNLFAGLVLLVTRPFSVGDEVRVQAGALGGRIEGEVTDMTLIFVRLRTMEGPMLLPNSAVLAAAIGPRGRVREEEDPAA